MASLGFAACKQEFLSDRRTRQLLNYFRLRNLNKKNEDVSYTTETSSFFCYFLFERKSILILNCPDYLFGTISNTSTAPSS